MSTMPTSDSPTSAKRDTTANTLLAAVLLAAALTGVATLSAAGTGALQELLRLAGVGRTTVLEQEQRRQAHALAEIERILTNVTVNLGSIDQRAKTAQADAAGLGGRLAQIDGDIGALRDAMAKRAKQADALNGPASDRVVHGALMELASLRSTIDTNETANRKEFAAIAQRLDRLEQAFSGHDMTSASKKKPARQEITHAIPTVRQEATHGTTTVRVNGQAMVVPALRGSAEPGMGRRTAEERQAGAW
jgi:chromosome segregation ATPase